MRTSRRNVPFLFSMQVICSVTLILKVFKHFRVSFVPDLCVCLCPIVIPRQWYNSQSHLYWDSKLGKCQSIYPHCNSKMLRLDAADIFITWLISAVRRGIAMEEKILSFCFLSAKNWVIFGNKPLEIDTLQPNPTKAQVWPRTVHFQLSEKKLEGFVDYVLNPNSSVPSESTSSWIQVGKPRADFMVTHQ